MRRAERFGHWICGALACLGCGRTTADAASSGDGPAAECGVETDGCSGATLKGLHIAASAEVALRDVAVAGDGRVAIGGFYRGELDFGGDSVALPQTDNNDGFIAVFDDQARALWAKPFPGAGAQGITGVAFAGDGDLVAQGFSDPRAAPLSSEPSGGAFAIRFDGHGDVTLRRGFAGDQTVAGKVAADSEQAQILVGNFTGQLDFSGLQASLPPYVIRLKPDSSVDWIKQLPVPGASAAVDGLVVKVDAKDAIVVSGDLLDDASSFLVKLQPPDDEPVYSQHFSGSGPVHAYAVAVDQQGAAVVAGAFTGELDIGGESVAQTSMSSSDAWVAKFAEDGRLEWVKTYHGLDRRDGAKATAVAVDATGNVWFAGTAAAVYIDDELVAPTGSSAEVAFVVKLRPNGDKLWVRFADAELATFYGLDVGLSGTAWAGGAFSASLGLNGKQVLAEGTQDGFLLSLMP